MIGLEDPTQGICVTHNNPSHCVAMNYSKGEIIMSYLHLVFDLLDLSFSSLTALASIPLPTVSTNLNVGLPSWRFPSIFISATAVMFSIYCLMFTRMLA